MLLMFHQLHAFVILLWGILMSLLTNSLPQLTYQLENKEKCNKDMQHRDPP